MKEFVNVKDMTEEVKLPPFLKKQILEDLEVYDSEYGEDRDQYAGLGGYVAVIEKEEDFKPLEDKHYIMIIRETPEYEFSISEFDDLIVTEEGEYIKSLFILNNDYAITTYIKKELLPEDSELLNSLQELRFDQE